MGLVINCTSLSQLTSDAVNVFSQILSTDGWQWLVLGDLSDGEEEAGKPLQGDCKDYSRYLEAIQPLWVLDSGWTDPVEMIETWPHLVIWKSLK